MLTGKRARWRVHGKPAEATKQRMQVNEEREDKRWKAANSKNEKVRARRRGASRVHYIYLQNPNKCASSLPLLACAL